MTRSAFARHLPPSLVLIAAAAFAFNQTLFFGYRLIGNSDRLNTYLSFILFHTHNLEQGRFSAWSEYVFNGFDTLALSFSDFTPLYALPALFRTDDVVAVFGIVTPALLAITLGETYLLAYKLCGDRLAALAGACTYGFATYGLLKIVQDDQTYLSVLTAPAFFYLIHTTIKRNALNRYVLITLLVTLEFYFAFLQEFSYNVIFFFVYCGYLLLRRDVYPTLAFGLAMVSGAVLSAPRLLVQYQTLAASGRSLSQPVVYDVVDARSLLRFFSRDIFGHSWGQSLQMPGSPQLNLHEGDLVHSSVFGALLFVLMLLSVKWVAERQRPPGQRRYQAAVFILYALFAFAVMHNTHAYLLLSRLYGNVSFHHARIGVSALLPIALASALFLAHERTRPRRGALGVVVLASAVIIGASALDFSSVQNQILAVFNRSPRLFLDCSGCLPGIDTGPLLAWDVFRFTTLAVLFVGLVIACSRFGQVGRSVLKTVLAVTIVFQTTWGAADYLEGPQTREYRVPFETNDFVVASADQFLPPARAERDQMDALLDNAEYRSVTLCPQENFTQPNCSTMMGMSWGIRLVDGYSSGVPRRLAALPWPQHSEQDIRFKQASDLPWPILSFLNTRQAIRMSPELYMNIGGHFPANVQLVRNPSPYIYPRAYFATSTQSVDSSGAEAAVQQELKTCPPACDGVLQDRFPVDYVEGPVAGVFDARGDIRLSGGGDRLTLQFPPSSARRFVVVNEMWDPGWTAVVDGHQAPVYATNVVMRGVLVPEGASQVVLEYRSLLYWAWWYTPGLMALGGLLGFVARRWLSRRRSRRLARLATLRLPSDLPAEPPVPTA